MTERRTRPRRRILVVIVAIAVTIWFTTRDREPAPLPPPTFSCDAPVGESASLGSFRWSFALPVGGSYELRIYDDVYTLLGSFADLTEPLLDLEPELEQQIPESITWEVFARDAAGVDLGSCRSEAQRRP